MHARLILAAQVALALIEDDYGSDHFAAHLLSDALQDLDKATADPVETQHNLQRLVSATVSSVSGPPDSTLADQNAEGREGC